jgi:hypothetical protein
MSGKIPWGGKRGKNIKEPKNTNKKIETSSDHIICTNKHKTNTVGVKNKDIWVKTKTREHGFFLSPKTIIPSRKKDDIPPPRYIKFYSFCTLLGFTCTLFNFFNPFNFILLF